MAVYVSDLLTVTPAPVDATPASTRALQWLRGSTTISGATSTTYTTTADDIGSSIFATQLETNFLGTTRATSAATETVEAYNPAALFRASEPGVWYDPNDISTLFIDPAGTTPVTTPGNRVGLMLDKSRGLVLGPELVDTANTSAAWIVYGTNTVVQEGDAVKVTFVNDAQGAYLSMTAAGGLNTNLTIGKTYLFTCQVKASGGTVSVAPFFFNGSSTGAGSTAVSSTDYTTVTFRLLEYTGGAPFVRLETPVGTTGWIRSISVREIPGNHATQATETKRPNYGIVPAGGRRNRLLWTEDLTNAIWTKNRLTISSGVSDPNGGTSAFTVTATDATGDLYQAGAASNVNHKNSIWVRRRTGTGVIQMRNPQGQTFEAITVTSEWQRFTSNVGLPFGGTETYTGIRVLTTGDAVDVYGAQCELGSTATPYQRVTTQYDVTEAGVASLGYLQFDGTDDFMSTGTITPGTDKAQVFAGVRKLSDIGDRVLVEFGPTVNTTNGTFGLFAPSAISGGTAGKYVGSLRGTAQSVTEMTGFPAPISNVLSALYDISGATIATESIYRINGVVPAQSNSGADAGTGNFLAHPLYLGYRNSSGNLFLSGLLFPLIVRFGPNLTAARILSTELWVGERTSEVDIPKSISPNIYTRSGDTILDRANSIIERRTV